jgi:hypothetical protein
MSPPPRKWLKDRISGDSKYGDRERPWFPCCWVAPPVGWCPFLLEENGCCKMFGGMGIYASESARFYLMHLGFMLNLIALLMIVYASLAISDDYDLLEKTSFSELTLVDSVGDIAAGTTIYVGLRSIALSESDSGPVVIGFDQFCATDGFELFMSPSDCDSCQSMTVNYVISIMFAAVLVFPSLFINISRMYSGYDVNCSKFFSGCLSICSMLLCLNTLFTYKFFCGDKFYQGFVPFGADGSVYPAENSYFVEYDWKWGWGTIFLVTGVVLKGLEMLINCCIPTPSIARDKKEQTIYEDIQDWDE